MEQDQLEQNFNLQDILAGRYRVERFLGAGGMGSVYIVRDELLNDMQIALKILHPSLASNKTFSQRFLQEVELMRRVSHTNVIRTFDVGVINGLPYYTMEFIEGKNLSEISQDYFLDPDNMTRLIVQICHGLYAIHSQKIIHRDLKPENIMLAPDGGVKIADFGIAKRTSSKLTDAGTIIGSPNYMAPEVWQGLDATCRTDLYSLGVILYECITGSCPFEGSNPASTMVKHLNQVLPPLAEVDERVPNWVSDVVQKLLQKRPEDRHSDALSVITHLSTPAYGTSVAIIEKSTSPSITEKEVQPGEAEKPRGKTPEGLLLSSNPTSREIAEEEKYYTELAKKRKDQIANTLAEAEEEAKREATRKIKLWFFGTLYVGLATVCSVFLYKYLRPSPEELRNRELARLKQEAIAGKSSVKEKKSSGFSWLDRTSNPPSAPAAPYGSVAGASTVLPQSSGTQTVVTNTNTPNFLDAKPLAQSNGSFFNQLATTPKGTFTIVAPNSPLPIQQQPAQSIVQQAPQATVPLSKGSAPVKTNGGFYNKIAPSTYTAAPVMAQQPAPPSIGNAPVLNNVKQPAPSNELSGTVSWISAPSTVRDIQDSIPGVEDIVAKVSFVGANTLADFNARMDSAKLDLIQRRAFLIRELRGIEILKANRDSKSGNSEISTDEVRIEKLRFALKSASIKVDQSRSQLAKLSSLASELNSATTLSATAKAIAESFNPDFVTDIKDLPDSEAIEKAKQIITDKQPNFAAALVNFSQAQQLVQHDLDVIEAAKNDSNWKPSVPELNDLNNNALDEHKVKIQAQLDTLDAQIEPVARIISESSLGSEF